jgi:hypothetical protein
MIRTGLVAVGTCLVAIRRGLLQLRARPIVFGFLLTGDHQIPFPPTPSADLTGAQAP